MRKLLNRYLKSNKGVAAVEFAIVLPFMLTLFFGTNEVTTGLMISRKVENVARVTTDLLGNYSTITTTGVQSDVQEIFAAAEHVIEPYDKSKLSLSLTGIEIDADGNGKVIWSVAKNKNSKYTCGDRIAVPDIYKPKKGEEGFIILGGANYAYTPSTTQIITGTIQLSNDKYWLARGAGSITAEPKQC